MINTLFKTLKAFFSEDLLWKIFALIIAVFLWLFVMSTEKPIETRSYSVKLTFENMESITNKGYVVANLASLEREDISIKVSGIRSSLDRLSNRRAEIRAVVDLSTISINEDDEFPKSFECRISPKLPTGISSSSVSASPEYLEGISIDKLDTDTRSLSVDTSGSPATGYTAGTIKCDVTSVEITGPAGEMAKATTVLATLDIADAVSDVTQTVSVNVYDDKNNKLENFTCNPATVTVSVPISKQGLISINEPRTTGALPDNLNLSSIEWEPKSVSVSGNTEQINRVKSIDLPAIDLTTIHQSTTLTFDISEYIEQAGLSLKNSSSSLVTVNINIGNTNSNTVTIKKTDLHIDGLSSDLLVRVPDEMSFDIVGSSASITASTLQPRLNLSGLGEGKHTVELQLTLPTNVSLSSPARVDVEIYKKNAEVTTEAADVTETTTEAATPIVVEPATTQ